MNSHILDRSDALNFIFAGNSIFTFLNTKTNNRFTYKVKKSKNSDIFFVYVLTSPDVYTYIGFHKNNNFIYSRKSIINQDSQSIKVYEYVIKKLINNTLFDFIEVWHEGLCGKCGRKLTVPTSIKIGIGPECLNKLSKSEKRNTILNLILENA